MLSEDEREERAGKTPLINPIFILLTEKQQTGGRGKMRRIWGLSDSDDALADRSALSNRYAAVMFRTEPFPPPRIEKKSILKGCKKPWQDGPKDALPVCECAS